MQRFAEVMWRFLTGVKLGTDRRVATYVSLYKSTVGELASASPSRACGHDNLFRCNVILYGHLLSVNMYVKCGVNLQVYFLTL
jgi:hypothetical protein